MKKIIGLYGRAQCGKTTTLRMLFDDLVKLGSEVLSPLPSQGDARSLLEYNGMLIAICTGGDTADIVDENCTYFTTTKCDIGISASRTKGNTCDILNNYAQSHKLGVCWVRKNIADIEEEDVNKAQVKDLIAIIDR